MRKPTLGITVGDPAGIGPEIAVKAAGDPRVTEVCEPVLYGPHTRHALKPFQPGTLSADAGRAAHAAIVAAVEDARSGRIGAIATAPINKEAFALAGLPWKGHTDLLAELTGTARVAMMFHADAIRVVLATIHVRLADVPALLTPDLVDFTIDITARELPRFGYAHPRIALAGLNPHAGEHGVIGTEDETVLRPAIDRARTRGIAITGPWPGDKVLVR